MALVSFIRTEVIDEALLAFWGIAWAALIWYSIRMVIDASKDQALTDATNAFTHSFIGFAIIACAAAFAGTFGIGTLSSGPATEINPITYIPDALNSVSGFIIEMSGGIFVLMIVLAGIRMVTTQGEQGAFDKAKHLLVINCAGVVLMFIARAIVLAVSGRSPGLIIIELKGIALFLLEVFGFVCVIALVIAGIYLILSIEESNRDKAKNIIIGTLITLIVILIMYAVIVTFV